MRVFQTVNYKATGPKKHKMSVKKWVVIIFAQIRL